PMFKSRDQLVAYFRAYAAHHALAPHLRFGHRVLRVEQRGAGRGEVADWRIQTTRGELAARYVAIATAINRGAVEPASSGRDGFAGRVLHSSAYRNPRPYADQRVLVVGSGNSAAEIALDLARGGASHVAMWVRGPRHFIRLRSLARVFYAARAL